MLNKSLHSKVNSELYQNDTVNSIAPNNSDTYNDNDTKSKESNEITESTIDREVSKEKSEKEKEESEEEKLENALSMLPEEIQSKIRDNYDAIDQQLGVYPFAKYYSRIKNREGNNIADSQAPSKLLDHSKLLDQMLEAAIRGDTNSWKYGESEKDFEDMKVAGWLPQKLTYDKYILWKEDRSKSFHEVFSSDSKSTREAILTILDNHIKSDNLGLNQLLDELKTFLEITDEKDFVGYSKEELTILRDKIITLLSNEIDNEIDKDNKHKLNLKLIKVNLLINIKTLSEIRDEDILNGKTGNILKNIYTYFSKNEDTNIGIIKNLQQPYQDFKNRISNNNIDSESKVDKDETHNVKKTSNVNKNAISRITKDSTLTVEDTSNLSVALRIGQVPVETCLNFENGIFYEWLLDCTEPNVKILIVRDENGKIIARSILRLLEQNNTNDLCIFAEPTYSSSSLSSIRTIILEHANYISKVLNIPLYLSEEYGDSYKLNKDSPSMNQEKLILKNIRAPSIYSDSSTIEGNNYYISKFRIFNSEEDT